MSVPTTDVEKDAVHDDGRDGGGHNGETGDSGKDS